MIDDNDIRDACACVKVAENQLIALLERRYPLDTKLSFMLSEGQVIPTTGTVIAHIGTRYGMVRVRMDTAKSAVRDIGYQSIVSHG